MMTHKYCNKSKQTIRVAAWLAGYAYLLWMICYIPVYAETKTVVVEGASEACYERESALNLARTDANNNAYDECDALGAHWLRTGKQFVGREQCFACATSGQFKCKVTQAMYICTNNQIERDKKAAEEKEAKQKADNERAIKEAAATAVKEKVDRQIAEKKRAEKEVAAEKVAEQKATKEKIDQAQTDKKSSAKMKTKDKNAIEDAFSNMEKQITEKADNERAENEATIIAAKEESVRENVDKKPVAQESSTKEKANGSSSASIGNTGPGGGIIFYVDSSGMHGLEAKADNEQPYMQDWEEAMAPFHLYGWRLPTYDDLLLIDKQRAVFMDTFIEDDYWITTKSHGGPATKPDAIHDVIHQPFCQNCEDISYTRQVKKRVRLVRAF